MTPRQIVYGLLILSEVIIISSCLMMIIKYDRTSKKHKIWIGSKILTLKKEMKNNTYELHPILDINEMTEYKNKIIEYENKYKDLSGKKETEDKKYNEIKKNIEELRKKLEEQNQKFEKIKNAKEENEKKYNDMEKFMKDNFKKDIVDSYNQQCK